VNDLIAKVNALYEAADSKNKELTKLIDRSKENLAHLDKIKSDLDAREVSLNDREGRISKIENIVEAKKTAEKLLTEARDAMNLLQDEKVKFDRYREKELTDIRNCKVGIDSSIQAIKEREEKLLKYREALEKEKLTFKTDIIRQMDRK
jgi:DNA repair exonuclease SbcCD ATPase subunit